MRLARLASPELLFGVFHSLVWLLLVLEISAGVVVPLAQSFSGPQAVAATLQ
jgi:hypothetical protein